MIFASIANTKLNTPIVFYLFLINKKIVNIYKKYMISKEYNYLHHTGSLDSKNASPSSPFKEIS